MPRGTLKMEKSLAARSIIFLHRIAPDMPKPVIRYRLVFFPAKLSMYIQAQGVFWIVPADPVIEKSTSKHFYGRE